MIRRVYSSFRNFLPNNLKSDLSKLIFTFTNKPFVKKDNIPSTKKFPENFKGGMIISADFELGWAWRYAKNYDDPYKTAIIMANKARNNFPFLLQKFDEYNIPITWTTVGHLFLSECKEGEHDWMRRIPYFENRNWKYSTGDWFDCDPYSNIEKDNSWYGIDLIEEILNAEVSHELGCHTFSHIDFSDKNCPYQVADDEIKACIDAATPFNIKLKSLVFPGGTWGNIKILKKYGFTIYRKNINFDLAYPYRDHYGLLVSPTSAGFGRAHDWTKEYYIKRYKKYIDKALTTGTVCHFWFHPSIDSWFLDNVFSDILLYAAEKREEGKLCVGTMGEIATYIIDNKVL